MAAEKLPIEVHDHFRKATILHDYVRKSIDTAAKHAMEAGEELLAAKDRCPPGSWEKECNRLFPPSLRTAQFYMRFATDLKGLPKAQSSAVLFLESGLSGAAKAARKAVKAKAPPKPAAEADSPAEPPPKPDRGKCPNCAGKRWIEDDEGAVCGKCGQPYGEPAGEVDVDQIAARRSKAVATAEALIRAVDDLQGLCPNNCHARAVEACKALILTIRNWK